MRIDYERSGGFAGLRLMTTIDSQSLDPEESRRLQELVNAAHFFDLPKNLSSAAPMADGFQYKITVAEGWKKHTVVITESNLPDEVQTLLQHLTTLARRQRGQTS